MLQTVLDVVLQFHLIIIAIIVVSLILAVVEALRARSGNQPAS
jgi:hypothetical protein